MNCKRVHSQRLCYPQWPYHIGIKIKYIFFYSGVSDGVEVAVGIITEHNKPQTKGNAIIQAILQTFSCTNGNGWIISHSDESHTRRNNKKNRRFRLVKWLFNTFSTHMFTQEFFVWHFQQSWKRAFHANNALFRCDKCTGRVQKGP